MIEIGLDFDWKGDRIDGDTEVMTVMLKDLTGETLFAVDLEPAAGA